jgi:hypothetical protein
VHGDSATESVPGDDDPVDVVCVEHAEQQPSLRREVDARAGSLGLAELHEVGGKDEEVVVGACAHLGSDLAPQL